MHTRIRRMHSCCQSRKRAQIKACMQPTGDVSVPPGEPLNFCDIDGFSSSGMRMEFHLSQFSRMRRRLSRMREFPLQLIRGVHEPRRLVKDGIHEFKSQLEQDLLRIHMFGMMAGSQHGALQGLE